MDCTLIELDKTTDLSPEKHIGKNSIEVGKQFIEHKHNSGNMRFSVSSSPSFYVERKVVGLRDGYILIL